MDPEEPVNQPPPAQGSPNPSSEESTASSALRPVKRTQYQAPILVINQAPPLVINQAPNQDMQQAPLLYYAPQQAPLMYQVSRISFVLGPFVNY